MNQPIESLPLLVPARSVIGASSAIGAAHTTDRANSTALERKVALVGFAREDLKRKLFLPSLSFFFVACPDVRIAGTTNSQQCRPFAIKSRRIARNSWIECGI